MKSFNIKKISMALVVTAFVSGTASANSSSGIAQLSKMNKSLPSFSQLINQYDEDKNETLSAKELVRSSKLNNLFNDIDLNKDKQISNNEYSQYVHNMKKSIS